MTGKVTFVGAGPGAADLITVRGVEAMDGGVVVRLGLGAGELIAECVLAVEMSAVASDVKMSIHAHPTLSETIMECIRAQWSIKVKEIEFV